jgi:antitoxin (DNA-binding transcriptional repressor) of toxin-antitoxin stability system
MSTVTLDEAKLRLGELVKSLPAEGEILITDGQKLVARLTLAAPQGRFHVGSCAELESKLEEGVQQLDAGEGIVGEVAMRELKAKTRRTA